MIKLGTKLKTKELLKYASKLGMNEKSFIRDGKRKQGLHFV